MIKNQAILHRFGRMLICLLLMTIQTLHITSTANADNSDDDSGTEQTAAVQRALIAAARNALKQNDATSAIFYYQRFLEQQPADRAVALEFAGVLSQAERFEEALAVCDRILTQYPNDPEALRIKAVALGRLDRTREALRLIGDLRARFPDDTELQRIEAAFLAMQGDRRFSHELYRELLAGGFDTARDWQDYLQLLAADRQWELLLETYTQYKERLTANDAVLFAVLQAHLARNEMHEVEKIYPELKEEDRRRDAALMIADRMAAAGRLADAIKFLEPITEQQPDDPNLAAKIALLEAYDKRPADALQRIDSIPGEYQNERLQITRAKIFWAAGRPGDALAELDRLALPEERVEASLARAGLLYDLHREWEIPPLLARISANLRQASAADRKLAWCLTIMSYIRSGNWDAARELTNIFKEREPDDLAPEILAVMTEKAARRTAACEAATARLGTRLRDYRPGMELIRPALLAEVPATAWRIAWYTRPTNPFTLLELARATEREGRIQSAIEYYEQATAKPETHVDALLGRANCAWRMNDAERIKTTAQLLRETPMNFRQLITAAEIMARADLDGLAESFFARVRDDETRHPDYRTVRAAWLIRNGRTTEARQLLAAIEPDGPAQVGALIYQYQNLAAMARASDDPVYQIARDQLLPLAEWGSAPGRADGMLAAADILMKHDEWDKAYDILKQLEKANPEDLRVVERLMPVYIRLGAYPEAEHQARKILARRPGDAARRGILARICVWQSDYRLAWRRYRDLIADYPEDHLFPIEMAAKRNLALSRLRRAAPLYAEYADYVPDDREMRVEEGDTWLQGDFTRAAADRYRAAASAFTDDSELRQALDTAERRSNPGVYARADYLYRRGDDRKADIRQDRIEAGARLPRGPDGLTLEAGLGAAKFRFDNAPVDSINARILAARGRWLFTNGLDMAGNFEFLDYNDVESNWRADLDVGYRGLDGWKVALIAGRRDVRENYYTILDGMQADWLGGYAQYQPIERLELFGQYRVFSIEAPQPNALVPTNRFAQATTNETSSTNAVPSVTPSTWERNNAHEAVANASWRLMFFPQSLRLWVSGYLYNTDKENDMYWTPDGTFLSGQTGLHWRHSPGRRHFTGAPLFFYGIYAGIGRDTEGDTSPMLKGELGLQNYRGWGIGCEAGRVWGDKYEETSAYARIEYQF